MTRNEYMNTLPRYGTTESMAHHRAYYAQFVTPEVKRIVLNHIGISPILNSTDRHLNDIPLRHWDNLHRWINAEVVRLLKETGEGNSVATGVCILKEAARQLKEEHT